MEKALTIDRTDFKESIKYHSLMLFSAYYKEIVIVDQSQSKPRTKKEAKKLRRSSNSPLPLIRKTYVIEEFEKRNLRLPGAKKGYTKPNREVAVKGFYRTSKNGKRSWVKPFTRYKDKGNKTVKEYLL